MKSLNVCSMNILSFDIEEWYLEKAYFGNKESKYVEYDRLLDEILLKLENTGIKGTFFCVGKMGTDFPNIVKKIHDAGHEIGCHSNTHQWLNKMSFKGAMEDTYTAVDALQQCIGQKVKSFRAPAFSIGKENKWAFEVLSANGITRDASVFPLSRDFGGFPEFTTIEPTVVKYNGIEIHEYPIATARVFGKEMAYSGGGYFRFFPYGFIESNIKCSNYSMTYFHLGDLNPVFSGMMSREAYEKYFAETGTLKARFTRYLKTNLGVSGNKKKLFRLIENIGFINIENADSCIEWKKAPVISL